MILRDLLSTESQVQKLAVYGKYLLIYLGDLKLKKRGILVDLRFSKTVEDLLILEKLTINYRLILVLLHINTIT